MDSDDPRRGPTCYRHDAMVERMAAVEQQIAELQRLVSRVQAVEQWQHEDAMRSQWFYSNTTDIKQVVAASKWAIMTRSIVAWMIGIIVSVVATLSWLRDHVGYFIK